jgi:hypothetical protein
MEIGEALEIVCRKMFEAKAKRKENDKNIFIAFENRINNLLGCQTKVSAAEKLKLDILTNGKIIQP